MGSSTPRVAGERYGCEGRVYSTCLSSTHKYRRIVPHRGGSGVYDAPRPRRPLGRPGGPAGPECGNRNAARSARNAPIGRGPAVTARRERGGGAPRAGGSFLVNVSFTLLTLVRHWCSYLPTLAHSARTAHANTSKPTRSNISMCLAVFGEVTSRSVVASPAAQCRRATSTSDVQHAMAIYPTSSAHGSP